MLNHRWLCILVVGFLALLGWRTVDGEEKVPDWLRFDAAKPYAIFDAWKDLSTRRAVICLGENWKVVAGRLQNHRGESLGNTPLKMQLVSGKGFYASLQTDNSGYFIIYSPYSLELGSGEASPGMANGRFVTATPGYPASQAGQAFAHKRKAVRLCQSTLVMREDERAFYVLTCDDKTEFDADEFRAFEREYLAQKFKPRDPFCEQPRDPEGKPTGMVRFYDIRVVDEAENGVPDALVKYQLSGLKPGFQIRKTDKEGRCKIEEWPLPDGDMIHRILTIDAPGFGVGPVAFEPTPDVINTVRLARPAVVEGRIVDDAGNPLACEISVHYKRPAWIAFETDFHSQANGTFRFERVMPNEEFVVTAHGSHFGGQRWAAVRSDWLSLLPGATSKEVKLQLSLAAGIRGVVVSEEGTLVPVNLGLDYGPREDFPGDERRSYVGTNNGPWGPNDGRFGFYGLDNRPFRIRVSGWEVEPSEPIRLEPGEMRFVRVTLKKKLEK